MLFEVGVYAPQGGTKESTPQRSTKKSALKGCLSRSLTSFPIYDADNVAVYIYPGIIFRLLEYEKIADIGHQKNDAVQAVKSLLDCKNREQNR